MAGSSSLLANISSTHDARRPHSCSWLLSFSRVCQWVCTWFGVLSISYQCISELPLALISMTTPPTKNRYRRTLIRDNWLAGGLTTRSTIWWGYAGSGVTGDLPHSLKGIFLSSIVLIVFTQKIKLPRFNNENTREKSQKAFQNEQRYSDKRYLCLKSDRVQCSLRGKQQKSNLKVMRVKFEAEIDNQTSKFFIYFINFFLGGAGGGGGARGGGRGMRWIRRSAQTGAGDDLRSIWDGRFSSHWKFHNLSSKLRDNFFAVNSRICTV